MFPTQPTRLSTSNVVPLGGFKGRSGTGWSCNQYQYDPRKHAIPKGISIFQPLIFSGELLVFGRAIHRLASARRCFCCWCFQLVWMYTATNQKHFQKEGLRRKSLFGQFFFPEVSSWSMPGTELVGSTYEEVDTLVTVSVVLCWFGTVLSPQRLYLFMKSIGFRKLLEMTRDVSRRPIDFNDIKERSNWEDFCFLYYVVCIL